MSASEQERLVGLLSAFTVGAPFLFEPDSFQKNGRGAHLEPADLVWLSRGTVFLFTMTAGRRSYEQQNEHNFGPLRGWLRQWSLGQRLVGKNDWLDFDLALGDVDRIVLVSVVEGVGVKFQVHATRIESPRNEAETKVVAQVSVPTSVLFDLMRRAGTAIDLADLMLQVHVNHPDGLDEQSALAVLAVQHVEALGRAGVQPVDGAADSLFSRVMITLGYGLRSLALDRRTDGQIDYRTTGASVFNDLDWEMTAQVALHASRCVQQVLDAPQQAMLGMEFEVEPYQFRVIAADVALFGAGAEQSDAAAAALAGFLGANADPQPITLVFLSVGRPRLEELHSMLAVQDVSSESLLARVLGELTP